MKKFMKWLVPILFAALGIFCFFTVHGHSFLGIISCSIAGIIVIYYLIGLLLKRKVFAAKVIHTVFTSLLCFGLIAFLVTETLIIHGSNGHTDTQFQYLVVLGCKVNDAEPSLSLSDRIDAACDYLNAHPDVIAVLSGSQGSGENISEAQCMYNELTERGISSDRLWLEERATSTWENLQYSLDMIEEKTGQRPESIGILSSEYHLYRAGLFAQKLGVQAALIPAQTDWPTIRLNYFAREAFALWKHVILGG